ncbi:MAG TPA: hypothetical protein VK925_10745, partial [Jiangellaceae bacterium]|nr:hypothetical protein [Jiangellaceae bacterium]
ASIMEECCATPNCPIHETGIGHTHAGGTSAIAAPDEDIQALQTGQNGVSHHSCVIDVGGRVGFGVVVKPLTASRSPQRIERDAQPPRRRCRVQRRTRLRAHGV